MIDTHGHSLGNARDPAHFLNGKVILESVVRKWDTHSAHVFQGRTFWAKRCLCGGGWIAGISGEQSGFLRVSSASPTSASQTLSNHGVGTLETFIGGVACPMCTVCLLGDSGGGGGIRLC